MKFEKKATLSVCMIVKNEQQFIEGCLQSVADIADEIIVLDTGCTDQTIDIAKKFSAKIHKYTWSDDFSAARNASIEQATSDWILWIDADERLTFDSLEYLVSHLKKEHKPVIYEVQINNQTNDAAAAYLSTAHRMFTNHKGISFKGKIHEQLVTNPKYGKHELRRSQIRLDHLGYAVEGELKDGKNKRNLALLKKMVTDEPQNAYAHYTLGQQYSLLQQYRQALGHFKTALKLDQFEKKMTVSLFNIVAETCFYLGDLNSAKEYAEKSISMIDKQVSGYYMLYRIADKEGRYPDAIDAVKKMHKYNTILKKEGWAISTDILLDDEKLYFTQGVLEERNGAYEHALKSFFKILNKQPNNIEALNKAIPICLNLNRLAEADELLTRFFQLQPKRLDILEVLGTISIKLQKFEQAVSVFQALHDAQPHNMQIRRRLAGLYLKTGDEQKAADLLSETTV